MNRLLKSGCSQSSAASLLGVSLSTVKRHLHSEHGKREESEQMKRGRPQVMSCAMQREVLAYLDASPLSTLWLLKREVCNNSVSESTLSRFLNSKNVTFKKPSRVFLESESERVQTDRWKFKDVATERKLWLDESVYAVDEISFHEHDLRGMAWCKKGTRCNISSPAIRGVRYSAICALSNRGLEHFVLVKGSAKSPDIVAFFQKLKELGCSTIVCDNAASH